MSLKRHCEYRTAFKKNGLTVQVVTDFSSVIFEINSCKNIGKVLILVMFKTSSIMAFLRSDTFLRKVSKLRSWRCWKISFSDRHDKNTFQLFSFSFRSFLFTYFLKYKILSRSMSSFRVVQIVIVLSSIKSKVVYLDLETVKIYYWDKKQNEQSSNACLLLIRKVFIKNPPFGP